MAGVTTIDSPPTLLSRLLADGKVRQDQLTGLPDSNDNPTVEAFLIEHQLVTREDILAAYSAVYQVPMVHLKTLTVKPEIVRLIPEVTARRYDLVAYDKDGDTVMVALASPSKIKNKQQGGLLHELERQLHLSISLAFAPVDEIRALHRLYESSVLPAGGESIDYPVIKLVNVPIPRAVLEKFPVEIATKYQVLPFAFTEPNHLSVAFVPPLNPETEALFQFVRDNNSIELSLYQTDRASFEFGLAQYQITIEDELETKPKDKPVVTSSPTATDDATVPVNTSMNASKPTQRTDENANVLPSEKKSDRTALTAGPTTISSNEISAAKNDAQLTTNTPSTGQSTISAPMLNLSNAKNENMLDQFLRSPVNNVADLVNLVKTGNVPQIVAGFLSLAIQLRASDVHIEANREQLRLRYRVDGELSDILLLPRTLLAPIVSRIKILSEMKIDEIRIPQDGRFDVTFKGKEIDLRVSTLPTVNGEKVVMRILDKSTGVMSLEDMGLDGPNLERMLTNIVKPYGIILATGPTGSGKSTTLYAILQRISTPQVNIITLEDPVEYEIKGINQTQIKPKIGFTFAEGLRSILRQDPNIIMVGEIRDKETAEMATHAALTGHLVLSTLHTNTAAGAVPRLINMGIEPFLITSSINAIVGQRLVRRLCSDCKIEEKLPEPVMKEIQAELASAAVPAQYKDESSWHFYGPKGCDKCTNGYRGRIGIFEVMVMTEGIESLAVQKAPESVLQDKAIKEGMLSMKHDGLIKALAGETSVEEILKATLV